MTQGRLVDTNCRGFQIGERIQVLFLQGFCKVIIFAVLGALRRLCRKNPSVLFADDMTFVTCKPHERSLQ